MMVKAAAIRGQGGQFKVTDTSVTEVVVTCVREGKIIASKHASISDREVVGAVDAVIKKAYAVIFDDV